MKVQKLFRNLPQDPASLEPFPDWQELSPTFEKLPIGDCTLLVASIQDEDFDKLLHIFQSREEAMGAFLSVAMEHGWEEVPQTYCIYHAQEINGKLIAGLSIEGQRTLTSRPRWSRWFKQWQGFTEWWSTPLTS